MNIKTPLELRAAWLANYYTKSELAMLIARAEEDALNSPLITLAGNTEELEIKT